MLVTISDKRVRLEGRDYFVGRAGSVSLGAWGNKESSATAGQPSYLDVCDALPAPKLSQVRFSSVSIKVEFADLHGIHLMAALSVPGLASGKVGLRATDFSTGKVSLVKVSPNGDKHLVDAINASPKVLDKLIEFGRSARVVKDLLIVVESTLYCRFCASAASGDGVIDDAAMLHADPAPGLARHSGIQIAPGVAFAYGLYVPKWDARGGVHVVSLRDDASANAARTQPCIQRRST